MAATCSTCDTYAGPTIRVEVDTVTGPVSLSLTPTQAVDLVTQLMRQTTLDVKN